MTGIAITGMGIVSPMGHSVEEAVGRAYEGPVGDPALRRPSLGGFRTRSGLSGGGHGGGVSIHPRTSPSDTWTPTTRARSSPWRRRSRPWPPPTWR